MPKAKTRKRPQARKTKAKSSSLGIYIVTGIACILILWLILKVPSTKPGPNGPSTEDIAQKKDKPGKKITKSKTKDKTSPRPGSESSAEAQPAPQVATDLETSITNALAELGVDKSMLKRSRKGSVVHIDAPLDKNEYDLYYANMVLKGRMEKVGAKLVSATEKGSRQTLTFSRENETRKFEVTLFLDSKPYKAKSPSRTISIVVDDFGSIGGDLLSGFFALPTPVTFAIFPGMKNSVSTMERAHSQGRESIIHVPMEPIGYPKVDPGKNAILVQMESSEIDRLLGKFLSEMKYCIGINNHMGSLATTDSDVMQSVMAVLKSRNKLFLDSRTTNVSVAYSVAQKNHLLAFRNDIFLDSPDVSDATMQSKLAQINKLSETKRNIIAITHCHSTEKLNYLVRFIAALQKAGYTLVPLSGSGKFQGPSIL
jgi:polysaccharide deacetylase 2 family uncharacterized protein YibQ